MELATIPSQDIILGIYALSTNQFPKLQGLVDYKNSKVSENIKILSKNFFWHLPEITDSLLSEASGRIAAVRYS